MIKTLNRKQCWAYFPVAMALVCLINRIRGQRNFRCEENDFLPLPYYSRVSLSCLSVLWDWRGNIRIRASSWCLKSACRKISLSSFQIMSFKDGIPWVSTYNFDKSFTKYFEETPLVHAWSFRAWERARTWIWLILFNPPGQRNVQFPSFGIHLPCSEIDGHCMFSFMFSRDRNTPKQVSAWQTIYVI